MGGMRSRPVKEGAGETTARVSCVLDLGYFPIWLNSYLYLLPYMNSVSGEVVPSLFNIS